MTNFVFSFLLSWTLNGEPDVHTYRVHERCSESPMSQAGWFTDYTEVHEAHLRTAIPPNTFYSYCVTAINDAGLESKPSTGIFVVFPRQ